MPLRPNLMFRRNAEDVLTHERGALGGKVEIVRGGGDGRDGERHVRRPLDGARSADGSLIA
jgi:hypothetical protein